MAAWDNLSMRDKSEIMGIHLKSGISRLEDIKDSYNKFKDGGNLYDGVSKPSNQMEFSLSPEDYSTKKLQQQKYISPKERQTIERNKFQQTNPSFQQPVAKQTAAYKAGQFIQDAGSRTLSAVTTFGGSAIGDAIQDISPTFANTISKYSFGLIEPTSKEYLESNRNGQWNNRLNNTANAVNSQLSGELIGGATGKISNYISGKIAGEPISNIIKPKLSQYTTENKNIGLNDMDVDQLLKLPDEHIESKTGWDRDLWEQIRSTYPPDRVQREIDKRYGIEKTKNLQTFPKNESQDVLQLIKNQKDKARNWINSDEWMLRRMSATNETKNQSEKIKKSMLNNVDNTKVSAYDITNSKENPDKLGFEYQNGDPIADFAYDTNNLKQSAGSAHHEILHGSNEFARDQYFKGINFPTIPYPEYSGVNATIDYLNLHPEQQVRGIRTLDYLKEKGLWTNGKISDNAIDHLKYNFSEQPHDVQQLTSNLTKDQLKDFLNKVYSTAIPLTIGYETYKKK